MDETSIPADCDPSTYVLNADGSAHCDAPGASADYWLAGGDEGTQQVLPDTAMHYGIPGGDGDHPRPCPYREVETAYGCMPTPPPTAGETMMMSAVGWIVLLAIVWVAGSALLAKVRGR
jgi:hypothetical protein